MIHNGFALHMGNDVEIIDCKQYKYIIESNPFVTVGRWTYPFSSFSISPSYNGLYGFFRTSQCDSSSDLPHFVPGLNYDLCVSSFYCAMF